MAYVRCVCSTVLLTVLCVSCACSGAVLLPVRGSSDIVAHAYALLLADNSPKVEQWLQKVVLALQTSVSTR